MIIKKSKKLTLFGLTVQIQLKYTKKKRQTQFSLPRSYIINTLFTTVASFLLFLIISNINGLLLNKIYSTSQMPFSDEVYHSLTHPAVHKNNEKKPQQIVFHGDRTKKQVALTFDADMTPQMKMDLQSGNIASYYDNELINVLINNQAKATLFMSGMWIESYSEEAQQLSKNPLFELANHTYSHPAFHSACYGLTQAHPEEKYRELIKTQRLLRKITGKENKLFRFPGGCYSPNDLDIVTKTGQIAVQWDVAGQDGFNGNTDQIVANVIDNVKNGSIIVLHMNGYPNEPATVNALPLIIAALRAQDFEFVTVSQLINSKENTHKNVKKLFSLKLD